MLQRAPKPTEGDQIIEWTAEAEFEGVLVFERDVTINARWTHDDYTGGLDWEPHSFEIEWQGKRVVINKDSRHPLLHAMWNALHEAVYYNQDAYAGIKRNIIAQEGF